MQALSICSLKKTYSNGFKALKGINLEIARGDFFALLGPNGAGKSTIIGIVCSLVNASSGKVNVFGYDLQKNTQQVKNCIGLVPQEINFNQFETVQNIVINQAGYYGIARKEARKRTQKCLKQMQLWDKRNEVSRRLSGGMKRRVMIARALVHSPRLLILDEPTAGVDIEIRHSMWALLQEINAQGVTIILTTHYLEEAEKLCRNIAIINKGLIATHTQMSNLLAQSNIDYFVLNLTKPIQQIPTIKGYQMSLTDQRFLNVAMPKETSLNKLFAQLSINGINVNSISNKSNRLEQLFMNIIADKD